MLFSLVGSLEVSHLFQNRGQHCSLLCTLMEKSLTQTSSQVSYHKVIQYGLGWLVFSPPMRKFGSSWDVHLLTLSDSPLTGHTHMHIHCPCALLCFLLLFGLSLEHAFIPTYLSSFILYPFASSLLFSSCSSCIQQNHTNAYHYCHGDTKMNSLNIFDGQEILPRGKNSLLETLT